MQLTLRYGVMCVWLWPQSSANKRKILLRGSARIPRRSTRGKQTWTFNPPQVPSNICCRYVFFFFLSFFTLPKNVFVKHLCILKSTYCSAHLWKNKNDKKKKPTTRHVSFHRRGPTTPPIQYSYEGFFLTSLIVSAFLGKHSVRQQNLPFRTPTPGAAELFLTRGLFSRLYLLFITCWRSCWDSAFGDDTTASETWRPHRALQVPPSLLRGERGGNLQFFFFMGEYFEFDHMQWL